MNINTAMLENILAERGMTKSDLAKASGVCRQSISVIIRRGSCAPKTAGKLAVGLGVSVMDIQREEAV